MPTKKQLADAAWERTNQLSMPMEEAPAEAPALPRHMTVPSACPACQHPMTVRHGWTMVFGDILQCGFCGVRISVPRDVYETFGRALHQVIRRK